MLKFKEQDALEDWLQRCPLGSTGIAYGVTRNADGTLAVTLDAKWLMQTGSLGSTTAQKEQTRADVPPSPVPRAPDTHPDTRPAARPDADDEAAKAEADALRGQLAKMQSMIAAAGAGPPATAGANATDGRSEFAEDTLRVIRGMGGSGGAPGMANALASMMAASRDLPADGSASKPPTADVVRAMLSQGLGTQFPKPPGFSGSTGRAAPLAARVVEQAPSAAPDAAEKAVPTASPTAPSGE